MSLNKSEKNSHHKLGIMKIACLGWGSLIWRPENLLIHRKWFSDGPFLPVEYVRQSNDGRLTLVLSNDAKPIRTLWALMATQNLEEARESLRRRENIPKRHSDISIASVETSEPIENEIAVTIQKWARSLEIDAVVWTNLSPKFRNVDGQSPLLNEAIDYLKNLDINTRSTAEEYIRRTPKQIDTEYRRKIESEFGWTYLD